MQVIKCVMPTRRKFLPGSLIFSVKDDRKRERMAFFFCFFTRPVQGQGRHALMIIYFAFVQKKREGGLGVEGGIAYLFIVLHRER